MAYYFNGAVPSFEVLKDVLEDVLEDEGWDRDGDNLVKGNLAVNFDIGTDTLVGLRGRAGVGSIGGVLQEPSTFYSALASPSSNAALVPSWPLAVRIFTFNELEVYCIAIDQANRLMYMMFGRFDETYFMPNEGQWMSGTANGLERSTSVSPITIGQAVATGSLGGIGTRLVQVMPFWGQSMIASSRQINANLAKRGAEWLSSNTVTGNNTASVSPGETAGVASRFYDARMYDVLSGSNWNGDVILLPYRVYLNKVEMGDLVSLFGYFRNMRKFRMTNNEPGDIIDLAGVQWMVFPAYLKNTADPNAGGQVDHSGTHGFAIRYERN